MWKELWMISSAWYVRRLVFAGSYRDFHYRSSLRSKTTTARKVVLKLKYFLLPPPPPTHHLSNYSWQIIRLLKAKGAVDDPSQEGADRWCSLQMWGSGDHKNTSNYRPIGLSPSYPKLPETAKPAHFLSTLGVNRPPLPFHNSGTIRPGCKTSAYQSLKRAINRIY